MENVKNQEVEKRISEKNIKFHTYVITGVCFIFFIVNAVQKNYLTAVITLLAGIIVPVLLFTLFKDKSKMTKGIFLTQMAVAIIVLISSFTGELHTMFPLLIAATALGGVYYSVRNVELSWAIIDAVVIIGIFFRDYVYVGTDMNLIIKGFIGINIAAFMMRFIMKINLANINEAERAAKEADELLVQVQARMNESTILSDKQRKIMNEVSDIANKLESTAYSMSSVSSKISAASQEQANAIQQISADTEQITKEAEECMLEAKQAAVSAEKSAKILKENNCNMQKLVESMNEINVSSQKISSIIKTIEDISFQTNILALNAAVEAARAGSAGKGFAVVADEVRNLANKSAEAAMTTTKLINESIEVVENGTEHAKATAEQMNEIIESSNQSEKHSREIEKLTKKQQDAVHELRQRIASVSDIIIDNTQTAEESAEISRSVSEEIEHMYKIVSNK
ncbi:MAG: methyl-accepting chemotaxis protein [Oscillospiraceae bacterium]